MIPVLRPFGVMLPAVLITACAASPDKSPSSELTPVPELIEKGNQQLDQKLYPSAIFYFKEALAQNPEHIEALIGYAHANRELNNLLEADKAYDRVLTSHPSNVEAMEGKGLVLFKMHDYVRAREQLNIVLQSDNKRWRSWNTLGVISDLEGDYKSAQDNYYNALNSDNTNSVVLNNLGYSYIMSHEYKKAEKTLREAIHYQPGFFRARNNLAIAMAWQSQYEEAVSVIAKAVKREIAYNNIGYIAMLNKDYEVAKRYFKKAISLSPTYYERAARNLEKLQEMIRYRR